MFPPMTFADQIPSKDARLLLVDDDRELCQMLCEYLQAERFEVHSVHDGLAALERIRAEPFDLIILDVMLPGASGFDMLRDLGAAFATPIVMLTAHGDDIDRIVGLELGADDYLSKPFNPRELVARIRAILRRASPRSGRSAGSETLEAGPIRVNMATHQASVDGRTVSLTGAEFRVLEILMRSAGQVLSREMLTETALGRKLVPYDRSIDTHISNLRRKLNLEAGKIPELKNVRGAGYMLAWASPG